MGRQAERGAEEFNGLMQETHGGQRIAEIALEGGIAGSEGYGLPVRRDRLVMAAERLEGHAAIVEDAGAFRLQREGGVKGLDGFGLTASGIECGAQIAEIFGTAMAAHGALQMPDRRVGLALLQQEQAEQVIGSGVAGLAGERLCIEGAGSVPPAGLMLGQPIAHQFVDLAHGSPMALSLGRKSCLS